MGKICEASCWHAIIYDKISGREGKVMNFVENPSCSRFLNRFSLAGKWKIEIEKWKM